MDLPAELRDLIDLQAGLARRRQLLAGGDSVADDAATYGAMGCYMVVS
jgi:hypothetical protein